MNNDLSNLYQKKTSDVEDNIQNNNQSNENNNQGNITNNVNHPQNLSSLYNQTTSMDFSEEEKLIKTDDNLHLDKDGISKLYNQSSQSLEDELIVPKEQNTNNQPATPIISEAPRNNQRISDLELLETYIGPNFQKIATHPFNFAAFFFTTYYFYYRKKYLLAIFQFCLYAILSSFINYKLVSIGLGILCGVAFNGLYVSIAKNNIEKEKLKSTNMEELKTFCRKKGGTSIISIFIGFFINVIIGLVISIIL